MRAHAALVEVHLGGLEAMGHGIEPAAAVGRPRVAQVPALPRMAVTAMRRRGADKVMMWWPPSAVAHLTDGAGALQVRAGVVGAGIQQLVAHHNTTTTRLQQVVLAAAVAVAADPAGAVAAMVAVVVGWIIVGIVVHRAVDLPCVGVHRGAVDNVGVQQVRLLLLLLLLQAAAVMRRRCPPRLLDIVGVVLGQAVRPVQVVRLLVGGGGVGGGGAQAVLL